MQPELVIFLSSIATVWAVKKYGSPNSIVVIDGRPSTILYSDSLSWNVEVLSATFTTPKTVSIWLETSGEFWAAETLYSNPKLHHRYEQTALEERAANTCTCLYCSTITPVEQTQINVIFNTPIAWRTDIITSFSVYYRYTCAVCRQQYTRNHGITVYPRDIMIWPLEAFEGFSKSYITRPARQQRRYTISKQIYRGK